MNGNVTVSTTPADQVSGAGATEAVKVCNICGGTAFKPGPNQRLSIITNLPPKCEKCGSLERHRAFRSVFDRFRSVKFRTLSCLMFSRDPTVAKGWFGSMRYSLYGTDSSLDVQAIDVPDAEYDVVVCNHVLEHVPRYEEGLRELMRVTKPSGFLFVSFPAPHYKRITSDWGYAKPEMHGHYRVFGSDIEQKLPAILPGIGILRVIGTDPATATEDRAYFFSRNRDFLAELPRKGIDCQVLSADLTA